MKALYRKPIALMSVLALLGTSAAMAAEKAAPEQPLNILPLGDSITYGYGPSYTETTPGGYRTRLYQDLVQAGRRVNFVGTLDTNPSPELPPGATHHDGHSGYRIDQIADNLDGHKVETLYGQADDCGGFLFHRIPPPDVILLLLGTNDINENQGSAAALRMDALINQITTDQPQATLVVGQIIPFPESLTSPHNRQVQAFNQQIIRLVQKYQARKRQVTSADLFSSFLKTDKTVDLTLYRDNVHPNKAGYDKLGDAWFKSVR